MESKLRGLWSQILDIDEWDLDGEQNFFEAGGDSVGALRLVEAAQAQDVALNIEAIFASSNLIDMAARCRTFSGGSRNKENKGIDNAGEEAALADEESITSLAMSCQINSDEIEDAYPASADQEVFLTLGMTHGIFLLQWVFQVDSEMDQVSLIEAWNQIHRQRSILRTRLVKHSDHTVQVVLKEDIEWEHGVSLDQYRRRSLSKPVGFGHPLFRYALIKENGAFYFVWTAHHAGFDSATRRMIFSDLQKCLSDPQGYRQKAGPTNYKSFVKWYGSRIHNAASSAYWNIVLTGFRGLAYMYPLSLEYIPKTTARLDRYLTLKDYKPTRFTKATIAHAAWAVALGNITGERDVLFTTTRLGRHDPLPGIESIWGPMALIAPVRAVLDKTASVAAFLDKMQRGLVSMIPYERDGMSAMVERAGQQQMRQSYLSWHPLGDDVLSREVCFTGKDGGNVRVRPRRDLSTPSAVDFALTLDIYDQGPHLDMSTSWDATLQGQERIERLTDCFADCFRKLITMPDAMVGNLWPDPLEKWP